MKGQVKKIYKERDGTATIQVDLDCTVEQLHKSMASYQVMACSSIEGGSVVESCGGYPGQGPYVVVKSSGPVVVKVGDSVNIGACPLRKSVMTAEQKLETLAKALKEDLEDNGAPITLAKAYSLTLDSHPALYREYRREKYGKAI